MMKLKAVFVAMLMLSSLAACSDNSEDAGVDTGVVIERYRKVVVVLEDDGEKDKHSISKSSRKCPVGSRWPDCKS